MKPSELKPSDFVIIRHGSGTRIALYHGLAVSRSMMALLSIYVPKHGWTDVRRINFARLIRKAKPFDLRVYKASNLLIDERVIS